MKCDICPVCGWLYIFPREGCIKCGSSIRTIKTQYDMSYYEEMTKLTPNESISSLVNIEIARNSHYNPEIAKRVREEADRERNQNAIHPNILRKIEELKEEEHRRNNDPKCPTCGSYNVKRISHRRRAAYAMTIGIVSTTARSQFECLNCKYKF